MNYIMNRTLMFEDLATDNESYAMIRFATILVIPLKEIIDNIYKLLLRLRV